MSTIRALVTALTLSSTALFACVASPPEEDDVTSESAALANNGGGPSGNGLTAAECTGCGCSLVLVRKTDECRYYKCVCDTKEKAECAGGKASMIAVPNTPVKVIGAGAIDRLDTVLSR